ncbi:MAG TPA: hypothetical protein VGX21_15055 [Methylomirabilota bacterium]|nr:hypothetical protein [Methylomirabilota bacterium]
MKTWMRLSAGLTTGLMLWTGTALAQQAPSGTDKSKTPQRLEGQVVKIDPNKGKVTVRASDGTTHEFQASAETLKDLKVGDRIEAKLREAPKQ